MLLHRPARIHRQGFRLVYLSEGVCESLDILSLSQAQQPEILVWFIGSPRATSGQYRRLCKGPTLVVVVLDIILSLA